MIPNNRIPTQPGEILQEEFLSPLGEPWKELNLLKLWLRGIEIPWGNRAEKGFSESAV